MFFVHSSLDRDDALLDEWTLFGLRRSFTLVSDFGASSTIEQGISSIEAQCVKEAAHFLTKLYSAGAHPEGWLG